MTPTLFEAEAALQQAMDAVAFSEGDENAHLKALAVIQEYVVAVEEKRDRVAMFLRHAASEADFLESQAVALADKAERIRKAIAKLNDYVLKVMEFEKTHELKGKVFRLCAVNNPSHVEIVDEKALPEEYVRTRVTQTPDKKMLAEALKAGKEIPGATLAPGQCRLVIK